jgi:hypothetical protein
VFVRVEFNELNRFFLLAREEEENTKYGEYAVAGCVAVQRANKGIEG